MCRWPESGTMSIVVWKIIESLCWTMMIVDPAPGEWLFLQPPPEMRGTLRRRSSSSRRQANASGWRVVGPVISPPPPRARPDHRRAGPRKPTWSSRPRWSTGSHCPFRPRIRAWRRAWLAACSSRWAGWPKVCARSSASPPRAPGSRLAAAWSTRSKPSAPSRPTCGCEDDFAAAVFNVRGEAGKAVRILKFLSYHYGERTTPREIRAQTAWTLDRA